MFKFSYQPPKLFLGGNFYQKLPFLAILGAVGHIFKTTAAKFGMRVRSWGSLTQAKFCKKSVKEIYPFGENLYQKLPFFAMFWAVSPHLLSQNGKIWREGANLGDRPQAKFCKNSLKCMYIPLLGKFIPKNTNFGDFLGCNL